MINVIDYFWGVGSLNTLFTKNENNTFSILTFDYWGEIPTLSPVTFLIERHTNLENYNQNTSLKERLYNLFNLKTLNKIESYKNPLEDVHFTAIIQAFKHIRGIHTIYLLDNEACILFVKKGTFYRDNFLFLSKNQLYLHGIDVNELSNESLYIPLVYQSQLHDNVYPLMDIFIVEPGLYEKKEFGEEMFWGKCKTLKEGKSMDFTYISHSRRSFIEENKWMKQLATLLKCELGANCKHSEWDCFFSFDSLKFSDSMQLSFYVNDQCIAQLVDAFIPFGTSLEPYIDCDVLILRYESDFDIIVNKIINTLTHMHHNINRFDEPY